MEQERGLTCRTMVIRASRFSILNLVRKVFQASDLVRSVFVRYTRKYVVREVDSVGYCTKCVVCFLSGLSRPRELKQHVLLSDIHLCR
jgi:hypothetical protein